ncbi:MAG: DUF4157 domain-containing protein [Cyanobacteria bacterium P01_H01_bin.21]
MARSDRTSKKKQQSSLSKNTTLPSSRPFLANTDPLETVITPKTDTSTTSFNLSQIDIDGTTAKSHLTTDFAPIQPKLTIGEPGDKYEQEADNVAKVVVQQINSPQAQRDDEIQRSSPTMSSMTSSIQRQGSISGGTASNEFESHLNSARSGGSALEPTIKGQMESAMGADFSGVKIHTGHQADQLSRSIQAKAFTTGQDVFFKQGEYNPSSRSGQELLAHELTHVVQQSGNSRVQRHSDKQEAPVISEQGKSTVINRIIDKQADKIIQKLFKGTKVKMIKTMKINDMKKSILGIAKMVHQDEDDPYKTFINGFSEEEFENECKRIKESTGNPTKEMADDIRVPQGYYHVSKKFGDINGLMTDGAGTCTCVGLSAVNTDGEPVYAMTHIDKECDIPKVLQGMIKDMAALIGGIEGEVKAYTASGGMTPDGILQDTPKDVIPELQKLGVKIKLLKTNGDLRIGGKTSKNDQVKVGDNQMVDLQNNEKSVDGLIAQVNAMPKMKKGHNNWTKLEDNESYSTGKHDPMESLIDVTLTRARKIEKANDPEMEQGIINLKEAIKSLENWYNTWTNGKKMVEWAQQKNN